MAVVNLNRESYLLDDGNDSKVIIRDLADIPGGRALDVTGWTPDTIRAGHVIKKNTTTGEFAPLGLSDNQYVSLSEGEEYAGILKVSVLTKKAAAAIMTMGEVNAAACPYPISDTIKSGLPHIKFI